MIIKNIKNKPIAFRDNIIAKEKLPYPIVYYPGFYGAFFAFSKDLKDKIIFCSCNKKAIENYIELRIINSIPCNSDPTRNYILDSMYFPLSIVKEFMAKELNTKEKILKLTFPT